MPEKRTHKSFLQKLINRFISNLTGEDNYQNEHLKRPVMTGVISRPVQHKHRKRHSVYKSVRNKLPEFLQRMIGSEPNHRKNNTAIGSKVMPPLGYSRYISSEPSSGIHTSAETAIVRPAPVKPRQKIRSKRKSLYIWLFGTSNKRIIKEPLFKKKKIRNDLFKAFPEEGIALLNSTGLFILAYLVIYLFYQLAGAVVASFYGIDSVLFYYELYFPIGDASPLWNRLNIIAITLASPFISVLISILLFKVVLIHEKLNPQLRLFLLWMAFLGATHFLGAFVAGIATSQGFGYVANWMYLNVFFRILIALIFLFLLTVTGYHGAVFALETLPAGIRQQRWRLNLALGSRFILPWILGGLLIMVVKYPVATPQHGNISIYDAIIMATMGFMVIPAFFNHKARPRPEAERPNRNKRLPGVLMIALALIALVVFRLFLERGLHFVIQFSFDVGFYR